MKFRFQATVKPANAQSVGAYAGVLKDIDITFEAPHWGRAADFVQRYLTKLDISFEELEPGNIITQVSESSSPTIRVNKEAFQLAQTAADVVRSKSLLEDPNDFIGANSMAVREAIRVYLEASLK